MLEAKLGCVTKNYWFMSIYLAWCLVCLGLVNRLFANVSMAWHGMVWCGAVSLFCVTKHYVDMKIMSICIKDCDCNLPVSVLP